MDDPNSSFTNMFMWLKSMIDAKVLLMCMALTWSAWSYRNSVVHEEPWQNTEVGAAGFLKLVNDYNFTRGMRVLCIEALWCHQSRLGPAGFYRGMEE